MALSRYLSKLGSLLTSDGKVPAAGIAAGQVLSVNGIAFPATQSASTDANTLDDYEEGTWTPTLIGSTTVGSCTYSYQFGTYVKIGKQVTVQFQLNATSTHSGTGLLFISGLPFTARNPAGGGQAGHGNIPYFSGKAGGGAVAMGLYTDAGTSRIVMVSSLSFGSSIAYAAPGDVQNGYALFGGFTYLTD